MSSVLSDTIREIVGRDWPHGYETTLTRLADEGRSFHHTPPIYFVGDALALESNFVLFVSLNPNIDTESLDGRAELESLMPVGASCSFDDYFLNRCRYFESAAFDWKFYRPHAAFAAGLFGAELPTRQERGRVLASTAIAVDLCPFSGKDPPSDNLILRWIRRAQSGEEAYKPFSVALELFEALLRAHPVAIVARFQSSNLALRRLVVADETSVEFDGCRIPYAWFNEPNGAVSSAEAYERGQRMRITRGEGEDEP